MSLDIKALRNALDSLEAFVQEQEHVALKSRKQPIEEAKSDDEESEELDPSKSPSDSLKEEEDEEEEMERLLMEKHAEKFGK